MSVASPAERGHRAEVFLPAHLATQYSLPLPVGTRTLRTLHISLWAGAGFGCALTTTGSIVGATTLLTRRSLLRARSRNSASGAISRAH